MHESTWEQAEKFTRVFPLSWVSPELAQASQRGGKQGEVTARGAYAFLSDRSLGGPLRIEAAAASQT